MGVVAASTPLSKPFTQASSFTVKSDKGDQFSCTTITGAAVSIPSAEVRYGDSPLPYPEKVPGAIAHTTDVVMGWVILGGDTTAATRFEAATLSGTKAELETLTIELIDADLSTVLATWELFGCFVRQVSGFTFDAASNKILIESVTWAVGFIKRPQ